MAIQGKGIKELTTVESLSGNEQILIETAEGSKSATLQKLKEYTAADTVSKDDYNALQNKPQIGGKELKGNQTVESLGLQESLKGKTIATINGTAVEFESNVQLARGSTDITVDSILDPESTNAIQNKAVSAEFAKLESQVGSLLAGNVKFGFSASPGLMFVGETKSVTLSASLTNGKGQIAIARSGGATWKSAVGVGSFSKTDSVTGKAGVCASYTASSDVYGKHFTGSANVTGVYPIYAGAGNAYTDVSTEECKLGTPKTSPSGDYKISIVSPGQKAFFLVPSTMTINTDKVSMGGFLFPLTMSGTRTINDMSYKVYESGAVDEVILLNIKIG